MEFERKKNRLGMDEYFGRKRYFVTTCCRDRRELFRRAQTAAAIAESLREEADRCGFVVHAYCVMPDHVHFLVEGNSDASDLIRFVKSFKQVTSFACRSRVGGPLWQRSSYDHILRGQDSLADVAWYIWMNPVRKGMCEDPRDYPFSGTFSAAWPEFRPAETWVPPWKAKIEVIRRKGQVEASRPGRARFRPPLRKTRNRKG